MGPRSTKPAIVGTGATEYYKRGTSLPQTQLDMAARAIVAALEDAGLSAEDVDGFSCYANAGGMDLSQNLRSSKHVSPGGRCHPLRATRPGRRESGRCG